jgi:hypothetical protein
MYNTIGPTADVADGPAGRRGGAACCGGTGRAGDRRVTASAKPR